MKHFELISYKCVHEYILYIEYYNIIIHLSLQLLFCTNINFNTQRPSSYLVENIIFNSNLTHKQWLMAGKW